MSKSMAYRGLLRLVIDNDNFRMPRGNVAGFQEWLQSWGAAERTINDRCTVVNAALRDLGDDPAQVTTDLLTGWLGRPRLAPWSRVTYYHHLRSYFAWLADTNQIPADPTLALKRPKQPKDKPRPLSDEEVRIALLAAEGHVRAWLLLGLLAGLRAHEMAKLRGVDVTEDTIYVEGKGRRKDYLPTHPDLWVLAQDYPRAGWWFPSRAGAKSPHIAGQSISTMVTQHFSGLGIEGSTHRTRHTFATQLLRSGVNIRVTQELMRHTSLATTAKYTAVGEAERIAAVRGLVA